ncbi:MAG: phosphoribosylamine--glycine ligase [Flavobacteriales bacterium Tduv]
MKILIVGAGGREHAIGRELLKNTRVHQLYFAPGNGGTARMGENIPIYDIKSFCKFAEKQQVDLTIVGSEPFLAKGIVDVFQAAGLKIFGPDLRSARLESSKVSAKSFMKKYGVRTAAHQSFSNHAEALNHLSQVNYPLVIKASGLASGKGVVITKNLSEARSTLDAMMEKKIFGASGCEVVIEEFLEGYEASILSIFNGKCIVPFLSAKDHKKIGEGEQGFNTGGMGAIAPNPYITDEIWVDFQRNILQPTLKGLLAEGWIFSGVVFFGLMLTAKGIYLLEYNLRMGDPETQVLLPLMESDLLELIEKALHGEDFSISWKKAYSCCVVVASKGYPEKYEKGKIISGLDLLECPYYVAGAQRIDHQWITSGGRVLNVVGIGNSAQAARQSAYREVEKISFDGAYFRKDIGL